MRQSVALDWAARRREADRVSMSVEKDRPSPITLNCGCSPGYSGLDLIQIDTDREGKPTVSWLAAGNGPMLVEASKLCKVAHQILAIFEQPCP